MTFDLSQTSDSGLPPATQIGQEQDIVIAGHSAVQPLAPVAQGPLSSAQPAFQNSAADTESALEEDWVEKAKNIVERTKSDPFAESNELYKVKTEFLKARYDKQINRPEDHP